MWVSSVTVAIRTQAAQPINLVQPPCVAANPVARSQIEIASGRADCLPLIEDQAHRAGFEDPNALQSVRVEMF